MAEQMKRMCSMCKIPKPLDQFRFMKHLNRYYCYCNNCNRIYLREYKRAYREIKKAEQVI